MKKTTLDFIKKLTKNDDKNLSQKGLKLMEEVGELARVILPFENAHATTHRFSTREQILEECADIYLTNLSIVFDHGFTYQEFEDVVERKLMKWAELQQRHTSARFPVPFEIHITVRNANQENFRQVCDALDVKPIVLALQLEKEELEDVMTSSKHFGDNASVYKEMKRISSGLDRAGFNVVREKIETVPWHPAAPSSKHANPIMPLDCYFETHLPVHMHRDTNKERLQDIAIKHNAHLSRNAFKMFDDGSYTQMVTYRCYEGTYENFQEQMEVLRTALLEANFEVGNEVVEFSLYDTKVSHDASWIGK